MGHILAVAGARRRRPGARGRPSCSPPRPRRAGRRRCECPCTLQERCAGGQPPYADITRRCHIRTAGRVPREAGPAAGGRLITGPQGYGWPPHAL